jgi:hypothetical protein
MKPRYRHYCKSCNFVASIVAITGVVEDWYVCNGFDPSVIARFGDENSEYYSTPMDLVEPERIKQAADGGFSVLSTRRIVSSWVLERSRDRAPTLASRKDEHDF